MIVVFDTNAYRDIVSRISIKEVEPFMQEMIQLERNKDIKAYMCSIAAEEILGHLLDDENTRTYKSCIKATVAMYMHCGDDLQFRLVPSPQTQIALEYFRVRSDKFEKTQQILGQLAYRICKCPTKANVNKEAGLLAQVKQHLFSSEKELSTGVLNMGKKIDPSYTDWNLFIGNTSMRAKYLNYVRSKAFRIEMACAFLGAVEIILRQDGLITMPTGEDDAAKIDAYIESYESAINMMQLFYEQVLQPGFDVTRNSNANYLWDSQILHLAGHRIKGEEILLVTSDKLMIRQADNTIGNKVMDINEYKELIGLSHEK